MIEDKLTPDQRIRLEAVAQANARLAPFAGASMARGPAGASFVRGGYSHPSGPLYELVDAARLLEQYIRDGGNPSYPGP